MQKAEEEKQRGETGREQKGEERKQDGERKALEREKKED